MTVLKTRGPAGLLLAVFRRFIAHRAKCFDCCISLVTEGVGLEVGGPSGIFSKRGLLPIYPLAARIDNCNFASSTVWQRQLASGSTFRFDRKRLSGQQYIGEGTNLDFIPSATYDFVLSSHTLEHTANPLAAMREWARILNPRGILVLVVPDKEGTFDRQRPVTALDHLVEDWERGMSERDLTHLPEILALHDLALDPDVQSHEAFRERSERNFEFRCLHHHVFDTALVAGLVDKAGMKILATERLLPFHIIAIAQKI